MDDPITAFLPYKYEAIPHVRRLTQDARISERTGWNLRKAIRWKDVHDENNSSEILMRLGDSLVDGKDFDLADLLNVHQLLLKRSTYNSKTRSFDRPAKVSEIWKRASDAISIANKHPEYVTEKLMASGYGKYLKRLSSEAAQEWLNQYGRVAFYAEWLNALIAAVRKRQETKTLNLPGTPSFGILLSGSMPEIVTELTQILSLPYEDYDLDAPDASQLSQFLSIVSEDMGLGPIDVAPAPLPLPSIREIPTSNFAFLYEDFEGINLLRISRDKGFTTVKVNIRHPLVTSQDFSNSTFQTLIEGILMTCEKINYKPEEEEEFLKYLGLTTRTLLPPNEFV